MLYTLRFFFLFKNAVCFIILTYLVPVLFTFYIQRVLKLKKNNSGAKRLSEIACWPAVCTETLFQKFRVLLTIPLHFYCRYLSSEAQTAVLHRNYSVVGPNYS